VLNRLGAIEVVCSGAGSLAYTTGFVDYQTGDLPRYAQARLATPAPLRKRRQGQLLRDAGAALSRRLVLASAISDIATKPC